MNIKFGTGGLRATMGPGPDHLNKETIQEATLGVADYALTQIKEPKIAIAYDSRLNSEEFARETARVLAAKGCRVYLYAQLMPTPALSFAVRNLQCDFGICITASHNPKEYNGYKVYGSDGGQITDKAAGEIWQSIVNTDMSQMKFFDSFQGLLEKKQIQFIPETVIQTFLDQILAKRMQKKLTSDLQVVYTPLNGAGYGCVTKVLKELGIENIHLVSEQVMPDGHFPTCPYPNPEEPKAMELGIQVCREKNADILLATDPDSDRIGVAARVNGDYKILSGNQVGVLLLDYILKHKKNQETLPERPVIIKTIVTTEMVDKIAAEYGAEVIQTLTGFKYVGEQIGILEKKEEVHRYVFGIEESCGYLIGDYVRDKDAVGAAMLICEMADAYKKIRKTLWDVLEELYEKYGHYETSLKTREFDKSEAEEYMKNLRDSLKNKTEVKIGDSTVQRYEDYLEGIRNLPKSNVLKMWMKDGSIMVVRPSGTEPKIKIYREQKIN